MEKNLSIIQGLTAADQANPIRITDAGELKTAVGNVASSDTNYVGGSGTDAYVNNIMAPGWSDGVYYVVNAINQNDTSINGDIQKLAVDQGKQFQTGEVYVADTVTFGSEGDVSNFINTSIGNWVNSHGPRYDDIIINSTPGNGTKSFLIVTIIRYY